MEESRQWSGSPSELKGISWVIVIIVLIAEGAGGNLHLQFMFIDAQIVDMSMNTVRSIAVNAALLCDWVKNH